MARIQIPEHLKGKDLVKFVSQHKEELLTQKKAMAFKHADAFSHSTSLLVKQGESVKAIDTKDVPEDADSIHVKVVCNAANWMDSHSDVLLADCWKKTLIDRKGMIYHLYDHRQNFEGEIGDVTSMYSQELSLTDLGINKAGTTQVLIMESDVKKSLNEKMFDRYKNKRVKQHSIGLQYVKIALAINDEDSEKEKALWDKHINGVINKQDAEEQGFFWVVSEIKLYENSAVIFGSNSLTPTIETGADTKHEPSNDTHAQPFNAHTYINNLNLNI